MLPDLDRPSLISPGTWQEAELPQLGLRSDFNVGTARGGISSVKGPGGAGAAPRDPTVGAFLLLGQWGRGPAQGMLLKRGEGK